MGVGTVLSAREPGWGARILLGSFLWKRPHQKGLCTPTSGPLPWVVPWLSSRFSEQVTVLHGYYRTVSVSQNTSSSTCYCLVGGETAAAVWRKSSAEQPKGRDTAEGGQLPDHGEPLVGQGHLHIQ